MIRLAIILAAFVALPAKACRLALVIAMDVSSSVDGNERRLQIEGLASALEDPTVQEVMFAVPGQPVALMVFEWSGSWDQNVLSGWQVMHGPSDVNALTARLRPSLRNRSHLPTALGQALLYARAQFDTAPDCTQKKIDVSGDGRSNDGVRPERVYDRPGWQGITVNGLAIESDMLGLEKYYRGAVIHGPEAFVETADGFEDFAEAMRRKLLRELGLVRMGGVMEPARPNRFE